MPEQVLGIIGTVLAAGSLGWNIAAFLLQGARPRVRPVIGLRTPEGIVTTTAKGDDETALREIITNHKGRLIVGVDVVNAGRTTLHVSGWGLVAGKTGRMWIPLDDERFSGTPPPAEIAPGASRTFFTHIEHARNLSAADTEDGRADVAAMIECGGRRLVTKPYPLQLLRVERVD